MGNKTTIAETFNHYERLVNGKPAYGIRTINIWQIAITAFREVIEKTGKQINQNQINFIKNQLSVLGHDINELNDRSIKQYAGALNGSYIGDRLRNTKALQIEVNTFRIQFGLKEIKFGKVK